MQAHYDTLGVKRDATEAQIKAAYRKLALKHHPDKPGGDAEKFKGITASFEAVMRNRGHNTTLFDLWAAEEINESASTAQAMRTACLTGNCAEVQRLLDAGADVSAVDKMGFTALKYACVHGQDVCAELLLNRDADVDQTSSAGVTALMESCVMGKEACVRILLEYDAKVDHMNKSGQTALMFACANGHDNCVRLLCEHGASKTICDAEGKAPADFARVRKHTSIAAWLEASFLRGLSRSASRNPSRNPSMHGGNLFGASIASPSRNGSSAVLEALAKAFPTSAGNSRNASQHGGSAFNNSSSVASMSRLWDWARGRQSPVSSHEGSQHSEQHFADFSPPGTRASSRGASLHGGQQFGSRGNSLHGGQQFGSRGNSLHGGQQFGSRGNSLHGGQQFAPGQQGSSRGNSQHGGQLFAPVHGGQNFARASAQIRAAQYAPPPEASEEAEWVEAPDGNGYVRRVPLTPRSPAPPSFDHI